MFYRIIGAFPNNPELILWIAIRHYIFCAVLRIQKCNEKCNEMGGHTAASLSGCSSSGAGWE